MKSYEEADWGEYPMKYWTPYYILAAIVALTILFITLKGNL